MHCCAALAKCRQCIGNFRRLADAVDRKIEPAFGQRVGNTQANSATAAGNQRHLFGFGRHN